MHRQKYEFDSTTDCTRSETSVKTTATLASSESGLRTDVKKYWKTLVVILAPLLLCPLPLFVKTVTARCAYVVLIMAVYWMTEALPLAITAFLPLLLYPPLGVLPADAVAVQYLKDSNFVFFGSMMMALAVEESQLHRRIALHVLMRIGSSPRRLMLGFMVSTGFLSMWMSNTAATAMMVPLAMAIINELGDENSSSSGESSLQSASSLIKRGTIVSILPAPVEDKNAPESKKDQQEEDVENGEARQKSARLQKICKGLLLSICYSANIGGTGTLTGTGSNVVLTGQLDSIYHSKDIGVTFASWMAFAVPQMVIMLLLAWLWLQMLFVGFKGCMSRKGESANAAANMLLRSKLHELGPMRFAEVLTTIMFVLLILLWLLREPGFIPGWGDLFPAGVSDGTTAMFIGCLLFVLPAKRPRLALFGSREYLVAAEEPHTALLTWQVMQKKFAWSIVILLGGGYAMAAGVKKSGLDTWIGLGLTSLEGLPNYVFVGLAVVLVTFLTEFSSNVAVASIFIPIGASVAEVIHENPLYLIIPIAVACSFAFMLPVATPPNAIVFGAGLLKVVDMALAGFVMNIICIFVLLFNINTYGYWLLGCDKYPSWARQPTSTVAYNSSTAIM